MPTRSSRGVGCAGAAGAGAVAADGAGGLGRVVLAATFAAGLAFFADVRFAGAFFAGRFLAAAFLVAAVLRRAGALATLFLLRFVLALALAFRLVAMTTSQLQSLAGSSTARSRSAQ